mgnify:FL=1
MPEVMIKSFKMVNGRKKLVFKKKTITRTQALINKAKKRGPAPLRPVSAQESKVLKAMGRYKYKKGMKDGKVVFFKILKKEFGGQVKKTKK